MSEEEKNYSANSIQVLEGLEAVRKRPSMYIGDTSSKGLHHLVYEVVDNSIDEALAGYATHIEVTINADNSITVVDNGRGIPVDMHEKEHKSALEVVLTVLHAGGKFDKGSYKVSGGLHGVGVSCVNALSTYLRAEVSRGGKIYMQEYSCGKPTSEVTVIGETDKTGTKISFKPDGSIFSVTEYDYSILATRLRDLAFLNSGITLMLTDMREIDEAGNPKQETFFSQTGLDEFVRYIDGNKESLINDIIHLNTDKGGIPVEVAMTYNTSFNENIYSFVNNINTIEGGTHLTGFRRGLTSTLKKYAEDNKMLEKAKVEIASDDFRQGLTAVISVKVLEPQFEGQTKTKLGNNEVIGAVQTAVSEALRYYLEEHPKQAKAIVDKVVLAAQARHAAYNAQMRILKKSPLGGMGGLPGKLSDCTSKNPAERELFLVEGDSAGGSAKDGRNSQYQAILPLRGRILNVEKAMDHKVFESQEIVNMFRALGVTIGTEDDPKAANLTKLRYHKIIIMTDADVDGAHIATLLMTFFFRRMREIIENGYLYIATPPLYKCLLGNNSEYCWDDQQVQRFKDRFVNEGNLSKFKIQRYKGLGEMDAQQLWETTMDPKARKMIRITISDAAEAEQAFTNLMGDDVKPRRDFIVANAKFTKNLDF